MLYLTGLFGLTCPTYQLLLDSQSHVVMAAQEFQGTYPPRPLQE